MSTTVLSESDDVVNELRAWQRRVEESVATRRAWQRRVPVWFHGHYPTAALTTYEEKLGSPLRLAFGSKVCGPGLPGANNLGGTGGSVGGSSVASRSGGFGGNSTGESVGTSEACSNASKFDFSSKVRSLNGTTGSNASSSTQRSLNSTGGSLKEVKTRAMQRTPGSSLKNLAHVKSSGYGQQFSSGRVRSEASSTGRAEAGGVEQRRVGGAAAAGNMNSAQSAGVRGSAEFAAARTSENKDSSGEREQSASSSSREFSQRTPFRLKLDVVEEGSYSQEYEVLREMKQAREGAVGSLRGGGQLRDEQQGRSTANQHDYVRTDVVDHDTSEVADHVKRPEHAPRSRLPRPPELTEVPGDPLPETLNVLSDGGGSGGDPAGPDRADSVLLGTTTPTTDNEYVLPVENRGDGSRLSAESNFGRLEEELLRKKRPLAPVRKKKMRPPAVGGVPATGIMPLGGSPLGGPKSRRATSDEENYSILSEGSGRRTRVVSDFWLSRGVLMTSSCLIFSTGICSCIFTKNEPGER